MSITWTYFIPGRTKLNKVRVTSTPVNHQLPIINVFAYLRAPNIEEFTAQCNHGTRAETETKDIHFSK
jgi:hypothetical protein